MSIKKFQKGYKKAESWADAKKLLKILSIEELEILISGVSNIKKIFGEGWINQRQLLFSILAEAELGLRIEKAQGKSYEVVGQ